MATSEHDIGRTLSVIPKAQQSSPPPTRRPGVRGLLPSTWEGRTIILAVDAGGEVTETDGVLLESFPFGPVCLVAGEKRAYSWERLVSVALKADL